MSGKWIPGNDFRLLENGEEFYPRVFECIAGAKQEVVLETFILFEDKVGNLESNVIIRDRGFNEQLSGRLEQMMRDSCRQVERQELGELSGWKLVRSFFVFHFIRRYPGWASWLPRHVPRLPPATLAPMASTAHQAKQAP